MRMDYADLIGVSDGMPDKTLTLSDITIVLCIALIDDIADRWKWQYNGVPVSDEQWEAINDMLGVAVGELIPTPE